MWLFYGRVDYRQPLGVVADQCPRCGRLAACDTEGIYQALHISFVPLLGNIHSVVLRCRLCRGEFAGEYWQYRAFLPPDEAAALDPSGLLARTNPLLQERLAWQHLFAAQRSDPLFQQAVEFYQQLRPGPFQQQAQSGLRSWPELDDARRADLAARLAARAAALRLAATAAPDLPRGAGWQAGLLVALAIGSTFLWLPLRGALAQAGVALAGLVAGALAWHALRRQHVRRWARESLLPRAQGEGVDPEELLAVVAELPASSHRLREPIHILKDHEDDLHAAWR